MLMSESFITCTNLVKQFTVGQTEVVALQGLDLSVAKGEMIGIVGVSGSGKSTLMNVLGGLMQPSSGQVRVDGHDLLNLTERQLSRYRREQVGFVWQQGARNLVPYLTALENVVYPMTLAGQKRGIAVARASQLLEMVGLGERMHHGVQSLSGGEQARVAIGVALANAPVLLLADEPTGELDTETSLKIYNMLRQLNNELDLTILIVSHDPGIARHVDRVVAIRDGRLASEIRQTEDDAVQELTIVDEFGRLQLPPDIRKAMGVTDRVAVTMTDDGVLIQAVDSAETGDSA